MNTYATCSLHCGKNSKCLFPTWKFCTISYCYSALLNTKSLLLELAVANLNWWVSGSRLRYQQSGLLLWKDLTGQETACATMWRAHCWGETIVWLLLSLLDCNVYMWYSFRVAMAVLPRFWVVVIEQIPCSALLAFWPMKSYDRR